LIVRGSSFATCKVAVIGNVCIWVETEGVLGKLHDLLIRHGKKLESECTENERPTSSELLGKAGGLRASLTPAQAGSRTPSHCAQHP